MAFTGKLGTSDSQLGNIIFGGGSAGSHVYTQDITETLTLSEVSIGSSHVPKICDVHEIMHLGEAPFGRLPEIAEFDTLDVLEFFETVIPNDKFNRNISETLVLSEAATLRTPMVFTPNINESLVFGESSGNTGNRNLTTTEMVVLVEAIRRGFSPRKIIRELLTLIEVATFHKYKVRNIAENLVLSETATADKILIRNISETLNLTETIQSNSTFNRNVDEVLPLVGGRYSTILAGNLVIHYNEVEFVKVQTTQTTITQLGNRVRVNHPTTYVLLTCPQLSQVILLPAPNEGDTEQNLHSMVLKRSMTNVLYTYTRRNNLESLKYTFTIGRPVCLALQEFVLNTVGALIDLTNWKGEYWKVNLINDPFDFTGKSLFENEGEGYEVSLEFQGVKIMG